MNAAWPKVTFDDAPLQIIDGDRGSNYPKQDEFNDEGHCLFLNTGNVTKSGFDFGNCQFITEQKDSLLRKGKLSREDVIMTTRGTIGNVGYFNRNVPFEHIRINSGMVIFRANREKLLPSFLYQYLRSEQFNKQVNSLRSGAAQPQLPIRDIKVIELPLPSVDQQEAISELISAYDDLIENNKRRIELLEESARQLYKEWFVRFRFPGHEHVKIIDGVREGWDPKTLSDIVTVVKDTVDPKNIPETTPYIGLEHLPRRSITLNEWENAGKVSSSKFSFKCGDILFGKIRPYFHKVGFTLTDGITSSDAIVLRPKLQKHYCVALSEVTSDAFVALASKTVREGSKMPRADWDVLKNRVLLEPPEAILNVFNNQIESILNQCKLLSFQNFNLIKARDILLPKLMSGEVAV